MTPFLRGKKVDKIKIFILLAIGSTAYYLLLQWSYFEPTEITNITVDKYKTNAESVIIDSEDLLTISQPSPKTLVEISDSESSLETDDLYVISNNVLILKVDPVSGAFVQAELLGMKTSLNSEENITLFDFQGDNYYRANSGFFSADVGYLKPNFSSISSEESVDSVSFILISSIKDLSYKRTVVLYKDRYDILVIDEIKNQGGLGSLKVTPYQTIERNTTEVESGFMTYAYLGPVFSTDSDKYNKISFDDIEEEPFSEMSVGGWSSIIQHYFLSAWIPDQSKKYLYQARKKSDGIYSVGLAGETTMLNQGESFSSSQTLFVGPKIPENLDLVQENLGLAVDYGWLFWLGKPLYWVLNFGFSIFGNWGLAIIFLTVSLKILLWPLSAAAYKSMAKMRALSPKLQELQAIHGTDKQKFSQEMMSLYQKEGVNPLGGCLPMLAQMPFFLAFYWVLIETVELRHAPFVFWIVDLSQKDPYFILPLLNAAGMYYSQTLTPTPPNADPMQAQMMKYMPLVFSVMFCFFPAGLVLYWLMNMLVTLVQQLYYLRPGLK